MTATIKPLPKRKISRFLREVRADRVAEAVRQGRAAVREVRVQAEVRAAAAAAAAAAAVRDFAVFISI